MPVLMVASVEVYTAEISWEPVVVSTRTRMRQTLPKEAMKLGYSELDSGKKVQFSEAIFDASL